MRSERVPSLRPINADLGYSFPEGFLVHNVGELVGSAPPNHVVGGNVAVDAVEGVAAGGGAAEGKFAGGSGSGSGEVVGYRREPSECGLLVLSLCHWICE